MLELILSPISFILTPVIIIFSFFSYSSFKANKHIQAIILFLIAVVIFLALIFILYKANSERFV